jgi:transposase
VNKKQFDVISKLMRSREPVMSAAKLVLVEHYKLSEAAKQIGISPQSVNNAVARFKNVYEEILTAFPPHRKSQQTPTEQES